MRINPISHINFSSNTTNWNNDARPIVFIMECEKYPQTDSYRQFFVSKKSLANPKLETEQDVNTYLINYSNFAEFLPSNRMSIWDDLYSINPEDKKNLANFIHLTFAFEPYFMNIKEDAKRVGSMVNSADKILRTEEILSEDEVRRFYQKTYGYFSPEDLIRFNGKNFEETEEAKDNLKFIKELMREENSEIFEKMCPRTLTKILFNKFLTNEDFCHSLEKVKEYELCTLTKYETELSIHEYLLGETFVRYPD